MHELLTIFLHILVPVFILIGIGVLMHRKFQLDLYTLAKLNIYFLVPGFIFVSLYNTELSMQLFVQIFVFFIILIVLLYVISILVSWLFRFNRPMRVAFTNSIIMYNSGNYGVPVNDLVFRQDSYAMSIQVIVLTFQNILTFSYGVFVLRTIDGGKLKALLGYFKMPVLYAMLVGIGLNVANIDIPEPLYVPSTYISDALIALALLTLGAQIAQLRFSKNLYSVYVSLVLRLLMGPLIALGLIYAFGMDGILAQALLISSAMPTSVNSAIIAQEYKNEPEFSAQVVLASTIFSMFTVVLVIYLARFLFA